MERNLNCYTKQERTMKNLVTYGVIVLVSMFIGNSVMATTQYDEKPKKEVVIYPNPASNYLRINYNATLDYHVVISNILGSIMYTTPTISSFENTTMLNLVDLNMQNGIYLLKVYEGSALKATQKLIIRK